MRTILAAVLAIFALLPPGMRGGSSSGDEAESTADAGTADEASSTSADAGTVNEIPATQFATLLGQSWSGRRGCLGEWSGTWRVSGGQFSLVSGSTEGATGTAFHAACEKFRSIGAYGGAKVSITLLGGVIQQVAVLAGGNSSTHKKELVQYFESACDGKKTVDGAPYDVVYSSCGGYDVGLSEDESDVSLYFFSDRDAFRNRMNSLPMPTKKE